MPRNIARAGQPPFFSVTISNEELADNVPVLLRGDLKKQILTAAQLGYSAVELQIRKPQQINHSELLRHCKDHEVSVSGIATGLSYTMDGLSLISDDRENRFQAQTRMKDYINLASLLETQIILGCIRGNIPTTPNRVVYIERFEQAMGELSKYAKKQGVLVFLEPINYYVNNYLNTIQETAEFLARANLDNVQMLVDTHHMNIEESCFLYPLEEYFDMIGYFHFSGENRRYPSASRIPYRSILKFLNENHFNGYISLECVPLPDPYVAAKNGLDYLRSIT